MIRASHFKDLLNKRPFKPFRLTMSSGEIYEVRHPEMAFVTKAELLVGLDGEDNIPADFKMCSLLHVTSVQPIGEKPTEPTAGGDVPVSSN